MTFFLGDGVQLCLLALLSFHWLWDSKKKSDERIRIRMNTGQRQAN